MLLASYSGISARCCVCGCAHILLAEVNRIKPCFSMVVYVGILHLHECTLREQEYGMRLCAHVYGSVVFMSSA